jgi:hypothetical protein
MLSESTPPAALQPGIALLVGWSTEWTVVACTTTTMMLHNHVDITRPGTNDGMFASTRIMSANVLYCVCMLVARLRYNLGTL